jgi:hypothetical protein
VPGNPAWDGRSEELGRLRGGVNGPMPRGFRSTRLLAVMRVVCGEFSKIV